MGPTHYYQGGPYHATKFEVFKNRHYPVKSPMKCPLIHFMKAGNIRRTAPIVKKICGSPKKGKICEPLVEFSQ